MMASASAPLANSTATTTFNTKSIFCNSKTSAMSWRTGLRFRAAAAQEESDCNTEECAPDKEVGKVSMEWLAGEKTKVVGTFPPKSGPPKSGPPKSGPPKSGPPKSGPPKSGRGWTGYVEKDTAGQTNIYSVEPVVYVAESYISSGSAGTSSSGAENTAAIAAFIGLISIAAASSIILQLGKAPVNKTQTIEYSGPSLTYYINKFKSEEIIPVSPAPSIAEASDQVQQETTPVEEISTSPTPTPTPTADSVTWVQSALPEAETPTSE